jgi:hypothetical protein
VFKFFNIDRHVFILLMIALMVCFSAAAIPAEKVETLGQSLSIDLAGQSFVDPDEDEPDPDPFVDPDEDEPDPDPFVDPDEDEPDPDPVVTEVYPLVISRLTTVLFQVDGAGLAALYNAAGQRLLTVRDGGEVVMTLAAGRYEIRILERSDLRGSTQLHLERVPNPQR